MHTHQHCLLCQSTDLKSIKTYDFAYLKKCRGCGFVFSERIPTPETLAAHYETYSRDDTISDITLKRYTELLDRLEKIKPLQKILDVGCGNGHFLKVAKDRGIDAYGTEFTDKAVEVCHQKGIQMHQGILNPTNYTTKFDLITSFEVIEHIYNPCQEVAHFYELLQKGGLVYVTTPNFGSISKYILKENWSIVEYPEHLSYYTSKTLRQLFEKQGFKTLSIETTGISVSRLQQGKAKHTMTQKDATETMKIEYFKHSDESLRHKTETNLFYKLLKKGVNLSLNGLRIGDSLKGVFQK